MLVSGTMTIKTLKLQIESTRDARDWDLVFAGFCLDDDKTLTEYGILRESLVHCTRKQTRYPPAKQCGDPPRADPQPGDHRAIQTTSTDFFLF
jgi:hypothetical protein